MIGMAFFLLYFLSVRQIKGRLAACPQIELKHLNVETSTFFSARKVGEENPKNLEVDGVSKTPEEIENRLDP